jgi:hypothetical protein
MSHKRRAEGGRYRKRPVEVEAMQFLGPIMDAGYLVAFDDWMVAHQGKRGARYAGRQLIIRTLEGDMIADPGDWIIQGVQGELYPCKPDIFAETYEPVAPAQNEGVGS